MSLKSWIVRRFVPSAKTLADMAASTVANGINDLPEQKKANVAKYSTIANDVSAACASLTEMLKDGSIEKKEEEEISALLEPIFEKLLELI